MSDELVQLLRRHVDSGTMPGAVAVVSRGTDEPDAVAVGAASVDGAPMKPDAIFRIQSMTKAVTTVGALRLIAAGRIGLDDPVERWLPELADRQVLSRPDAELDDTAPSPRPITVRHLLTNTSGYGMIFEPSPLQRAMADNDTEAGPDPTGLDAGEWLTRLASLPLAFAPGEGWRYHHSFAILGILLSRATGRSAHDHLTDDVFGPLGMVDTGYWVPAAKARRLPSAYRRDHGSLVEVEPAGGGWYAGEPGKDVSHEEIVSTAADYHRFLRMLATGGLLDGEQFVPAELLRLMLTDQVPESAKTPESFYPGFWSGTGWGFGVSVQTDGEHPGRWGWSGGLGTDFFVDLDGTIGILLTQVEMDAQLFHLLGEFTRAPAS